MSDPVSNAEIEDVLSSIRRLVSNEERGERPTGESAGSASDKLVLTPSLRVDDDAAQEDAALKSAACAEQVAPKAPPAAKDGPLDGSGAVARTPPPFALDDEDYSAAATVTDDDSPVREAGDPAGESAPDNPPVTAPDMPCDDQSDRMEDGDAGGSSHHAPEASTVGEGGPPDAEGAEWLTQDFATGGEAVAPDAERLRHQAAEFEEIVAARDDEWEPDGDTDDAYAGERVGRLPWTDAEVPEASAFDNEDADGDGTEAGPSDAAQAEGRSTPVGGAAEPDEDDVSSAAHQPDNDFTADESLADIGDTILDEESLRDMVSEIVRQELQGALGERITRNVRKLVRREIHRALTSQEFE